MHLTCPEVNMGGGGDTGLEMEKDEKVSKNG